MEAGEADRIAASTMSVSGKIRALNNAGYARADIARLLGKRYQHVRNVLEADMINRAARGAPAVTGVEEAPHPFDEVRRLMIDADGRAWIPADVVAALGGRPHGVLVAIMENDRLVILSSAAAIARVQTILASHHSDPTVLASEELIAERRAEALREELE